MVRMKEKPNAYHHGNLRLALIDAAVEQIIAEGVEKLSLRGLARAVGVSQTAPYRHFEDKNHLLAEIATQTFGQLYDATITKLVPGASATHNIVQTGTEYLRFARANPERYKMIFGPTIQNRMDYPNMIENGERCFGILIDLVEQGIKDGDILEGCALIQANMLWTQVHGLSSLVIDGFYENKELPMALDDFLEAQCLLAVRSVMRQTGQDTLIGTLKQIRQTA